MRYFGKTNMVRYRTLYTPTKGYYRKRGFDY